jgi:hypothetical protein
MIFHPIFKADCEEVGNASGRQPDWNAKKTSGKIAGLGGQCSNRHLGEQAAPIKNALRGETNKLAPEIIHVIPCT